MDRYAVEAAHLVEDEEDGREREDHEIAVAAGTCCSDPTPAEEPGDGPDEGKTLQYCQVCGLDLEPTMYAALVADLPGARARITRIRSDRRGDGSPREALRP